jgi:hypothetical protein
MLRKITSLWAVALVIATAMILTGCGANDGAAKPADTISGALPDVLGTVLAGANELLGEGQGFGMSLDSEITAENSQGMLGLTPEQFGQYVTEAYASNAAIMSFAHEVALVKCQDAEAAAEVKQLIADGFDSKKWVCVTPDQSYVIDSGSYVLLVATTNEGGEALKQSFETVAQGNVGEIKVFYTKPAAN